MAERHDERAANACFILGVVLEDAGEPTCAATMFRRAASRGPHLAAPHVRLGFSHWLGDDAAGMYEAFSVAVRLDPRAVREAVREKPEEARLINLVLYPRQYGVSPPSEDPERPVPAEVGNRAERLAGAEELVAGGRDAEAIEVLERLLAEDPEDPYPVPLLVLAHLLLRASGVNVDVAVGRVSALWGIEPGLARLLFRP